ncbi:MAG: bifunctional DNA primase/polymerase [Tateyamaria sp.]|uniref:bifunctional DNA primase/polymerase n=1 Tax=Tateyamaria sp. TaxID=1929288 RepID=UPI00329AB22F
MTVLEKSTLPEDFCAEIARLHRADFRILPLGGGTDGKAPMVAAWAHKQLSLAQIFGPMHRSGLAMYGICLDDCVVVDCDTDDPELVADLEARFGPSPVHVKTPRGLHLYYRAAGDVPNLHGEGLPVDIKMGPHNYVVGPLSQRPDGGFYEPVKGLLGIDALPCIRGASVANTAPILTGQRHVELVKQAMLMVEMVDDEKELLANLAGIRDEWCADPDTVPDSELASIAGWAWKCRLENRIFGNRDSAFLVHRPALDALRGLPNGTDAIALLVLLTDQHGHSPAKRFPLDFDAMREAGLINLSLRRLRAARRSLEAVGLLRLVGKHRAGSNPQVFVLTRVLPAAFDAENVSDLQNTGPGYRRKK